MAGQASFRHITANIAKDMKGECDVEIRNGYPHLENDEKLTKKAINSAQLYLGEKKVKELNFRMTAEDFSYYSQEYPSIFYRLGTSNEAKNITSQLHSSTFDIDEDALKTGMGYMAFLAISLLNE